MWVKSLTHSEFLIQLRSAQLQDIAIQALRAQLQSGNLPTTNYQFHDDLLFYRGRILVPADPEIRRQILVECHDTPAGGHGGVKRTLARIAPQFHWNNMRNDVTNFVRTCPVCQVSKPEHLKPAGLLQPLPIPVDIWSDLSMDFVVGLPPSRGKTTIMVVVDRLSKYAHFVALPRRFTAAIVAQSFVTDICRLHGMPRSIVSDRDPVFLSHFWQELFLLSGTTLKHSTAYHPETDGQTEITNRGLEQYLRCFCMDATNSWTAFLPWAEFSYNSATHSATRMSPFQAVYGRLPPAIVAYEGETTNNLAAHEVLTQRTHCLKTLRENLWEAQNRMKQIADRARRELQFQIGDKVLVRLQPYRQTSLADHSYSKLRRKFYGPFTVTKCIGKVAYKIDLPPSSKLHPIFHVSKLKHFHENLNLHPCQLPRVIQDGKVLLQPASVIRTRYRVGRLGDHHQALVQWEGMPAEEATWVDIEELRLVFPGFDLGDKVVLNEGRDVMQDNAYYYRRSQAERHGEGRQVGNAGINEDIQGAHGNDKLGMLDLGLVSGPSQILGKEIELGTSSCSEPNYNIEPSNNLGANEEAML